MMNFFFKKKNNNKANDLFLLDNHLKVKNDNVFKQPT
jgi:hypothetical protein